MSSGDGSPTHAASNALLDAITRTADMCEFRVFVKSVMLLHVG